MATNNTSTKTYVDKGTQKKPIQATIIKDGKNVIHANKGDDLILKIENNTKNNATLETVIVKTTGIPIRLVGISITIKANSYHNILYPVEGGEKGTVMFAIKLIDYLGVETNMIRLVEINYPNDD